ncbi:MAG: efflux RND transporter permease subunit [Anaerovoracaceae bacterium]
MGFTRFVLRRPVTAVLCVVSLFVFGISSIMGAKLELTPEMEMPVMLVATTYGGASPDDIDELVSKPIEDQIDTISGVDSVMSYSMENISLVIIQYEYGTNLDTAYLDLKKEMDRIERDLPDDADSPTIVEMDINDMPTIMMSVKNEKQANLYNYVNEQIIPEFEKINSVASVDTTGGQASYVRIQLNADKLAQYNLNMNSVVQAIAAADFAYPAGSTAVGGLDLSVSTEVSFDDIDSLKTIPISVGNGNVIYLQDVANVYEALEEETSISRYNGEDTITLAMKKQQGKTDIEVSNDVMKTVEKLKAADPNLDMRIIMDTSDQIKSALKSVVQTLIMAIITAMIIIFLFFGEPKASLIVGSSIPVAIFSALFMMNMMGFSLNMLTLGALVLGVGMMVDNSIVVLESCFRGAENLISEETYFSREDAKVSNYKKAALEGTRMVVNSVIGSTVTTCVVFLPLAVLNGMSGQMFKPLGFTIVFCMVASLISAITIVPLCYALYRPAERKEAPANKIIRKLQNKYREWMKVILPKRKTVIAVSVVLLILSFVAAGTLDTDLMTTVGNGSVEITIETRPGLSVEEVDKIITPIEKFVSEDENIEEYTVSFGGTAMSTSGSNASITAYLYDDAKVDEEELIKLWKPTMNSFSNCRITMDEGSDMSMSIDNSSYELILQSTQYDELKETSDKIVKQLKRRDDVNMVHSTLENAAPVVKVTVDPLKAAAEGLSPVQVGATINQMLSGVEATTMDINEEEVSVMVEYAEDEYDTLDKVRGITLTNSMGGSVALKDIAEIGFKDSPQTLERVDKQYRVTITAEYTDKATEKTGEFLDKYFEKTYLNDTVTLAQNSQEEMMVEEFTALGTAILTAVFLLFVVMAAQFESPRFSIMVMTTIPFSLIGSFGLLFLFDVPISMTSLLGFLILIGTVVNNGILYVDTVNQLKDDRPLKEAVVDAGVIRMRPIFMTTLTTIVAMIPLALGYGDSGEMLQGLALVDVGGLIASTVLALLMLPVYYLVINGKPTKRRTMKDKIFE